jgi:amino acid transporter
MINLPPAKRLNFISLVGVIFFTVSGGAYGLEPLVNAVGPGWAVLLVIFTPLIWSLPVAFMAAELSSMLPEEGGYYIWVRDGLGDFWAVQEGWYTICCTTIDLAIYPVLFVSYLTYFYPSLAVDENASLSWSTFFARWLISILIIVTALALNWRGARRVGHSAVFSTVLILLPFALLVFLGLTRPEAPTSVVTTVVNSLTSSKEASLLALGLSTLLWSYSGWDNVSTFAGEVNDAQRNYPRALMTALVLTVLAYLLPLLAGISAPTDPEVWNENQGWPVIAQIIGGRWLAATIAAMALLSAWSLLNSQLLYVSRLPYAMAVDGWLPASLALVSEKTGVPTVALAACGFVSALFAMLPFGKLVILEMLLYTGALLLQFIALMALRLKKPEMRRPFRVPGGWPSLILITIAPMLCVLFVAKTSFVDESTGKYQALTVIILIASGPLLYLTRRPKHHSLDQRREKDRAKG